MKPKRRVKKYLYILLFILLGVLVNFLVHGLLEMFMIDLLVSDFDRFSLGLSWDSWLTVHAVGSFALLVGFTVWGFILGRRFWRRIYGK